MATCSTSTSFFYFPSSSAGAIRPTAHDASISLPGRLSKRALSLSIKPTGFSSPKSGSAYLAARARTSEETSTEVSKQLEALPVSEEIPEEISSDVSKQLEVLSAGEEIPEESSSDVTGELNYTFTDLKKKFDAIEDKSTLLIYGSAAVVALLVSAAVVDAIESVPLLPKAMEFVGFGYTVWFVYRYLLFKKSREELVATIEELKQKITG